MSDKTARTHTHASNRAKPQDLERKVVYKSFLDTPFRIKWPSMPINMQNAILARVISILDGVAGCRDARSQANRKRKGTRKRESTIEGSRNSRKKRKIHAETMDDVIDLDPSEPTIEQIEQSSSSHFASAGIACSPPEVSQSDPPPILRHITVGINEVTKRLEMQVRNARRIVTVADALSVTSAKSEAALKIVFVCRADIDPPLLIEHLPHLVAAFNSAQLCSQKPEHVKIVLLPKEAEFALAKALGLRRVAVMALDVDAPELSTFDPLLDSVPTLTAPWLVGSTQRLIPTHIKQLRTSAPKGLKAAKQQRVEGKARAKERRISKLGKSKKIEVDTKK